jgi:hypothetical protein
MTTFTALVLRVPTMQNEFFSVCRRVVLNVGCLALAPHVRSWSTAYRATFHFAHRDAEEAREKEIQAAIVIQKYARGFLTRLRMDRFECVLPQADAEPVRKCRSTQ